MKYANDIRRLQQRLPATKQSATSVDDYRENPRNYSGGGRGMVEKFGSGGILERYREMLRERDEDVMRGSVEDQVPPLNTDEVVRIYEALLADLTINSKPMITDLTIIAGDQREHGEGIANAICCRIVEVPVDRKLPSLYLLDSIVKNIGSEYIDYFSARLPEVFLEAYRRVDPSMHSALRHLFGTWSKVFPDSVLSKIDAQLQLMSESPRRSHGIHVNPKYVEARRQSDMDNDKKRKRVGSSPLRSYGQRTLSHDEYSLDSFDALRAGEPTTGRSGCTSPSLGANRWFNESDTLHIEPDYIQSKATERDRGAGEWWRKRPYDRTYHKLDSSSAYNELNNPRALIDAYGNDRGGDQKSNWQDTPKSLINAYGNDRGNDRLPRGQNSKLNVDYLKEKNISNKVTKRSWKNTEEEEYDWDDMSPALAGSGKSNTFLQSSRLPQGGSIRSWYDSGKLGLNSDSRFRRSNESTSVPASSPPRGTNVNEYVHKDQRIQPSFQASQSLFSGRGIISSSNPTNIINSVSGGDIPPRSYHLESDAHLYGPPISALSGRSTNFDTSDGERIIMGRGMRPLGNTQNSHQPSYSILPRQKQNGEFNSENGSDTGTYEGSNNSRFLAEHHFDTALNNGMPSQLQFPNQTPRYISNKHPNQIQGTPLPSQYSSSRLLPHGYSLQGNTSSASNTVPNSMPGACFPNTASSGLPFMQGAPVSASVPRPIPPPVLPTAGYPQSTINYAPVGGAYSGLFSSLMSQGLISLTKQQDSIGVEFNPEALKMRHDSAINALYTDLPRQCTTCGIRFKDQELHRNHMDWHVTKNRMNKNRKQKPARKWFASASMWLGGTEAPGPEALPGFLPTETAAKNQDEEEMAVPADEDQMSCELCGEPFDDFYSHETDEWMYRGAVYLNGNPGSTAGLDRSQLGPIVHAKCRPDAAVNSSHNPAIHNQQKA